MFYRFVGEERRAVDLEGIHSDSCILVGGSPHLENIGQWRVLETQGVVTMAMNNVAMNFKPTYWIGADKPENYSKSILYDSSFLHFAYLSRCCEEVDGRHWKNFSNVMFMGSSPHITANQFFGPLVHFVWWKNVFLLALQSLYHLGFRKVYVLGSTFKISEEGQYSFASGLTTEQIEYNKRTYKMVLGQLASIVPHFERAGFELFSCTSDSELNEDFNFIPFTEVIEKFRSKIPEHNAIDVIHPISK